MGRDRGYTPNTSEVLTVYTFQTVTSSSHHVHFRDRKLFGLFPYLYICIGI